MKDSSREVTDWVQSLMMMATNSVKGQQTSSRKAANSVRTVIHYFQEAQEPRRVPNSATHMMDCYSSQESKRVHTMVHYLREAQEPRRIPN